MPHLGELYRSTSGAAQSVSVGASPFVFTATRSGQLITTGGTVSLMEYARDGSYVGLGITAGPTYVAAGDSVRVTYTAAPTMTFIPS